MIVPPFTRLLRAWTVQGHISTFMAYKYEQKVAK